MLSWGGEYDEGTLCNSQRTNIKHKFKNSSMININDSKDAEKS